MGFRSDYEGWKRIFTEKLFARTNLLSFRSDYEGWKQNLLSTVLIILSVCSVLEVTMRDGNFPFFSTRPDDSTPFVLEVTMRDGNKFFWKKIHIKPHVRFRSDYEGWKLLNVALYASFLKTSVLEVTMRDGNNRGIPSQPIPRLRKCFRSDYEGWKPNFKIATKHSSFKTS